MTSDSRGVQGQGTRPIDKVTVLLDFLIMMSPERQRSSLIAFFLGSTAAKLEVTDPKFIGIVSYRAYRDLSRTLHGIKTHPEAKRLIEETHNSIERFFAHLNSVAKITEFDDLHERWCSDSIRRFTAAPHPNRTFSLSYGQAQKWLNMTTKYFAVLGHPDLKQSYEFLHVPVDSIIYRQASIRLGVSAPRSTAWSRMDRNQYVEYQNTLRKQIRCTYGDSYAPLDWEADVWIQRDTSVLSSDSA